MNDMRREPRVATEFRVVAGGAGLAAHGVGKTYRKRQVVRNVTIELRRGEAVGLLGPNGAGKTTTFYMVVGLARPDSGEVRLGDEDITAMPMYQRARAGIDYLPQEASVFRKLTFVSGSDRIRVDGREEERTEAVFKRKEPPKP